MPVPPALLGWYRTAYPTLTFNPDWLEACVEYLQQNDPSATTTQGLIKAVEVQLLSSDLSTSVLPAPGRRGQLTTLHTATSPDKLLFSGGAKKAVLFQVQAVDDIAHSASSLLETLEEKREARKVAAKGGGGGGGRNMNLDDDEPEDEDEAKKKVFAGDKVASYPRGSGKLVLSDGETEVKAFELQRINGLGLEEIKLGTKLLVHDVPFIDGVMLLTPKNVVLKGYQVEELEQVAEWALENSLRARLDMEPLPRPDADAPPNLPDPIPDPDPAIDIKPNPSPPRAPPPPRLPPPVASSSSSRAKPPPSTASSRAKPAAAAAARPAPPVASTSTTVKAPSSDHYFDDSLDFDVGFDDAMDEDDDAAEAAMREMEEAVERATVATSQQAKGNGRDRERDPPGSSHTATAARVKQEPGSSGSRSAAGGMAKGTGSEGSGQVVEVLELDSDDDEGTRERPVKKNLTVGGSASSVVSKGFAEPKGGRRRGTTVLELDSDD
ncbi:hypothetical protein JCM1840_002006 [Sporobolomyces johnsonii]